VEAASRGGEERLFEENAPSAAQPPQNKRGDFAAAPFGRTPLNLPGKRNIAIEGPVAELTSDIRRLQRQIWDEREAKFPQLLQRLNAQRALAKRENRNHPKLNPSRCGACQGSEKRLQHW
jgi:hypothetical protein